MKVEQQIFHLDVFKGQVLPVLHYQMISKKFKYIKNLISRLVLKTKSCQVAHVLYLAV